MKSTRVLAGVTVLSIAALALIVSVAKADYTYYISPIKPSGNGNVWHFDTDKVFSGKDVVESSVVAVYWIDATEYTIVPKSIVLNDNHVALIFNSKDLPTYADGTRITGTLTNGKTFLATGPGFIFGVR